MLETENKVLTIARNTMPALKASAMRDFFYILDSKFGLYNEADHNKTLNEYHLNNNLVEFIGVNQADRVRGRKRNWLFLNEANENSLESWRQLAFRTTDKIVLDYNPSDAFSWIYDDVETRDDCDLFVTTYKDNPFLEKSLIDEIERLKDADADYWNIYGLGQIGAGGSRIFTHWREISDELFPFDKGQKVYGLDFGYNHPTALVEVTYLDNTLYWREILCESKLTTSDLIEKLKLYPRHKIIADAAEPKTIEEIKRAGFKIEPADKKSVSNTIDFIKSKPLKIHEASQNLLRQIKRYSWKTDKAGDLTDEVVKFDDDCCFVAGTMVETMRGEKPIETITTSDYVLTRKGYRKVSSCGITAKDAEVLTITLSNGKTLTATPNHPVWIEGKGFTNLDAVRYNDYLLESKSLWKSSNLNQVKKLSVSDLTGLFTDDTRKLKVAQTKVILSAELPTRSVDTIRYTETFGNFTTEKFQTVSKFTTKTATRLITLLKTWKRYLRRSIWNTTHLLQDSDKRLPIKKQLNTCLKKQGKRLSYGIARKRGIYGTLNTVKGFLEIWNLPNLNVNSVNLLSALSIQQMPAFALTNANQQIEGQSTLTLSRSNAENAEKSLVLTNIRSKNIVPSNVALNGASVVKIQKEAKHQTVYNLTVDEVPEYFANGFLVHNCDAARYGSFDFNQPVFKQMPVQETILSRRF